VSQPVLSIEQVSKSYRNVNAVRDLSFHVDTGSIYGLLGPNGSGKTTTIRMILGILLPDAGRISLWGQPPADSARERVGYLPEERGLYPKMRVLEHLVFLAELHGVHRPDARRRAERWLSDTEAADWAQRRVDELSKGQQQTVQLIGALIHDPSFVILDEPFTGLDPVNARRLRDIVKRLASDGVTVLLSTHRMDQVEKLCDAICLVSKGRDIVRGTIRDVKAQFGNHAVNVLLEDGLDATEQAFADATEAIVSLERVDGNVHLVLRDGVDAQEVLARAVRAGRVSRFEIVEPSIDEIFVKAVSQP
jgi:ABC-2 type transport system ATP-binding protein